MSNFQNPRAPLPGGGSHLPDAPMHPGHVAHVSSPADFSSAGAALAWLCDCDPFTDHEW